MTDHLQAEPTSLENRSSSVPVGAQERDRRGAGEDDDDDIFGAATPNDTDQARIRRRAPTRHSIKSLSGRKAAAAAAAKQPSTNEVRRSVSNTCLWLHSALRTRVVVAFPLT